MATGRRWYPRRDAVQRNAQVCTVQARQTSVCVRRWPISKRYATGTAGPPGHPGVRTQTPCQRLAAFLLRHDRMPWPAPVNHCTVWRTFKLAGGAGQSAMPVQQVVFHEYVDVVPKAQRRVSGR